MTIKRDYSEPMLKVVYLKSKQSLLTTSNGGVNATISGYDADNDDGYGFSQNETN
jgi:hypothetical protein